MNDGKDTMSVRVPDGFLELHRSFKIHSKQFVYETLIGWGLNPEKTYSFKGEYLEEQMRGIRKGISRRCENSCQK